MCNPFFFVTSLPHNLTFPPNKDKKKSILKRKKNSHYKFLFCYLKKTLNKKKLGYGCT